MYGCVYVLHLATCTYCMYRVDVFQFLFVEKGFIAERGYKECGCEDDKYSLVNGTYEM